MSFSMKKAYFFSIYSYKNKLYTSV